MDRIKEMKSHGKRFLLSFFVLGLALSWSDIQASQTCFECEEHSTDGREQRASSGRRYPVRVSQKRERGEISGGSAFSDESVLSESSPSPSQSSSVRAHKKLTPREISATAEFSVPSMQTSSSSSSS